MGLDSFRTSSKSSQTSEDTSEQNPGPDKEVNKLHRTVIVKLDVPEDRYSDLKETFRQYKAAVQHVVDIGWEGDEDGYIINSKTSLQTLTYDDIIDKTDLLSQHALLAKNQAADALSSCISDIKSDKTGYPSKPDITANSIRYDSRCATYKENYCTLATVNGRVKAKYVLPESEDNPQSEYLSDEWDAKESTLHWRDGEYYLHITVVKEVENQEAKSGTALGVDLNVNGYLAVTSTGRFIQSADYINHLRQEYERVRGNLQKTGTRSAHLTIQSIGDRFSRWSEDLLHRIANQIIEEAVEHNCSEIVFEDLSGIRDSMSDDKKFQQWMFSELYNYVEYKSMEQGIEAVQVKPQYTSQRCSKCGFTHEDNRPSKHTFCCQKCDYKLNADYNAAKNIAMKYVRSEQKSQNGRANCQLALKSGVLNSNGDFRSLQELREEAH